jgi:two-component system clock-associated histidine kinase SasA
LDLAGVCAEVVQALASKMAEKDQHLTTDIPSDLPLVYGDPDRIKQVISNLLDNAIKYSPSSGTIDLSILHRTAQKIQISISDNGPGIPDVSRNHIFEEHYRLERDEAQQGYGIGLSVCQQIVRAHYGQIWVDSAPDQGSCFNFTLPVYRP